MKFQNIIYFILFTFFVACSKYEEGPVVSLLPAEDRIANTWIIAEASSNGKDITDDFESYELFINDDGDAAIEAEFTFLGNNYKTITDGTWMFKSENEIVSFDYEENEFDGEYQILELRNDRMTLRQVGEDLELILISK
jgi:hypothetical protein